MSEQHKICQVSHPVRKEGNKNEQLVEYHNCTGALIFVYITIHEAVNSIILCKNKLCDGVLVLQPSMES